ncbi:MAG TPA: hypothetical protein VKU00_28195 [Chthonomonadaceae bacterium]|nr:hypothetical protein [Chthonomonadaceae bacterium]
MFKNMRRFIGKTLALVWAAFWVFFFVASSLSEPSGPITKAFVCLGGIGFFLGSALLGLRWDRVGGMVLTMEGIGLFVLNFTYFHNPPATRLFLLLTLAMPPLLAGILLLTPRPHPLPR